MNARSELLLLVGLSILLIIWWAGAATPPKESPASNAAPTNTAAARQWAAKLSKPGLKNFHQVTRQIYRGAQPTARGMRELEALGIKTIVSLRAFHSDKDELAKTKLARERISFKTWHPEEEDVIRFMKIVTDTNRLPVFVHCQHGSDRTGTMIAIYRMAAQGWSRDEAIAEMTQGGFGFHHTWQNLIRYLQELNVEEIKERAGIKPK